MTSMAPIHGFRTLIHPLAQIRAADEFDAYVEAFIHDQWADLYTDEPPDIEWAPVDILDALASLDLRFEIAGSTEFGDDGFWATRFNGGTFDSLLYGWAEQVREFLEIDHRAFQSALIQTNLIFVPDESHIAKIAFDMSYSANPISVSQIEGQQEAYAKQHLTKECIGSENYLRANAIQRGEGPRASTPALIDRAALFLKKNAGTALSPEQIAEQ